MQKIGDITNTANDVGEYTDGNPGAGVEPTLIKARWLNVIQRELAAVVEGAGFVLDPGRDDQVLHAIQILARLVPGAYALDQGTANVYAVDFTPPITALTDGMVVRFKAKTANSGDSTFNPNGLGAKPLMGGAHNNLLGGEIAANGDVWVQWNSSIGGGSWVIIASSGGALQIAPGVALGHAASLLQVQADSSRYALDTGAANVYAVAYTPALITPVDGMTLKFKAKTANSGASTFSPNGTGAKPIVGAAHSPLQGGEIAANGDVWVQYNSSIGTGSWVLIDSTGGAVQVAPATASNHAVSLGQFVTSFGLSGYVKFPNGFIIQWGRVTTTAQLIGATWNFPMIFPNRCAFWGAFTNNSSSQSFYSNVGDPSASNAGCIVSSTFSGSAVNICFAFGY
ncbi:hypothetical protein KVG88_19255 [Pseudomonas sp. SWRI74]|uniref:Putative tail fiber protein gp53-like C-terminal domain-containing protein n=1 Tax=Pseudomonas azerbaijanoccidentalis TaxID=2842347 RepID=A0ABS6QTE9_9PSED|nr:hypothetical protein [Pseudomonas azerbaijanoccidentalis]MBV4522202.1 hypothetical protein [Pseudomonas azerbaijanoccidentalis]